MIGDHELEYSKNPKKTRPEAKGATNIAATNPCVSFFFGPNLVFFSCVLHCSSVLNVRRSNTSYAADDDMQ